MAASSKDATFVRAPLQKTYSLFTAAKLGKSFDIVFEAQSYINALQLRERGACLMKPTDYFSKNSP